MSKHSGWPKCELRTRRSSKYYCGQEHITANDCWQCHAYQHEDARVTSEPVHIPPSTAELAWLDTLGIGNRGS